MSYKHSRRQEREEGEESDSGSSSSSHSSSRHSLSHSHSRSRQRSRSTRSRSRSRSNSTSSSRSNSPIPSSSSQTRKKRQKSSQISSEKLSVYEKAKEELEEILSDLPKTFHNITVLEFGEINPSKSFHSSNRIYPIGYKCEVAIHGTNQVIVVEIIAMDDEMEFLTTVKSSNRVFLASSEADVFRKYGGSDQESIFTLEIELLIEGLEGSLDCEDYKFHFERGYGDVYTTEEEYRESTSQLSLKQSRAMRNRNRQNIKSMTPEEIKQIAENKKKQQQLETEKKKKLAAEEKAQRNEMREQVKRKKELSKQQRESEREQAKKSKEIKKKEDKTRSYLRREILSEMKRCRHEAALQVVQYFDEEQEREIRPYHESENFRLNENEKDMNEMNDSIEKIFSQLPTLQQLLRLESDRDVTHLMDIVTCIHSLRSLLRISSQNYTLDYFNTKILGNLSVEQMAAGNGSLNGITEEPMEIVDSKAQTLDVISQDATAEIKSEENHTTVAVDEEAEAEFDQPTPVMSQRSKTDFQQDEVELDRIQLNLIRVVLDDLHNVFGLQEKEEKKQGSGRSPILPLNQLTWQEIARMIIVVTICKEMMRSEEEIINILRGSKQSHFKQAKNIVRSIRTRMALRYYSKASTDYTTFQSLSSDVSPSTISDFAPGDLEDNLMKFQLPVGGNFPTPNDGLDQLYDFTTDQEIISAIEEISNDEVNYSEVYRRCCKVWLRIVGYSQARNLIWEVDSNIYPDYYTVIKKPMTFAQVAYCLLKKSYSGQISDDSQMWSLVTSSFYRDMRQVLLNCFTYNTESIAIVSQAQRILQSLHRHVTRWVLSQPLPPISICTDQFCFFSLAPLISSTLQYHSIKCGRCLAIFSLDALHSIRKDFGVVLPTEDQVHGTDEWYCPYCLREDSVVTEDREQKPKSDFFFDEWGPSCLVPWQFNCSHGKLLEQCIQTSPQLSLMFDTLRVLSNPKKSSILQQELEFSGPKSQGALWTLEERLCVLTGLCEVLKGHRVSFQYLNEMYFECLKLSKMSLREPFHEVDFMDQVLRISGAEGVILARSMLEGSESNRIEEEAIKLSVIEGRCLICKESTFEEDCEGEVLLCDGCNADVHINCVGLASVPKGSWYCQQCKEKSTNQYDGEGYLTQLKDIQSLCNKEEEGRLIEEQILVREGEKISSTKIELMCSYCGHTEIDLCSPMVYGQSRHEFNAYMKHSTQATVDDVIPKKTDTVVKFSLLKEEQKAPNPPIPYFPLVKEKGAKKLRGGCQVVSPIVHEICALRMFAARIQKSKHETRRNRRLIAEKIAILSGISTQPLGYDDSGRSYWIFPNISTLFVAPKKSLVDREPDYQALLDMLHSHTKSARTSRTVDESGDWYMISELALISQIIDLLGKSKNEINLKNALNLRFSTEIRSMKEKKSDPNSIIPERQIRAKTVEEAPASEMVKDEDNSQSKANKREKLERETVKRKGEGKPVILSLVKEKGVEMQPRFVIKQENVFDNEREGESDDEDEESYLDYFTFSKSSKYYAIALLDRYDKIVKQDKNSPATIVFQIQKEGLSQILAYTPLSEPWSDGIYYFSTLNFKRSGKYTISFLVEGVQLSHIQPLVYSVNVVAENIRCGPSCALSQLRAQEYLSHADRQITNKRRELFLYINQTENEFLSVRSALLTLYLALPIGSLVIGDDEERKKGDVMSCITDATGWNNHLDQLWRNCVLETNSSVVLMECVLVLEYYLSKNWLMSPASRLLSSLPSPHFAIRCVTNSSVALRIFCLDKCLAYDRIQSGKPGKSDSSRVQQSKKTRTSKYSAASEEVPDTSSARPKRAAMAKAREALSETVKQVYDEGSEEDENPRHNLRTRALRPDWFCSECSTRNEDRNRSCVVCGSRRRNLPTTTTHLSRAERLGRRKKAIYGESGSESGESDEEDSDSDDSEVEDRNRVGNVPTRASERKRTRVSYREDEDEGEGEDMEEAVPKRSRNTSSRSQYVEEEEEAVDYIPPQPIDIPSLLINRRNELGLTDSDGSEVKDIPYNLLKIMEKLQDDPESSPFWEPVDTTIYIDYKDKVKIPMDMNSIIRRVEVGFYGNDHEDFAKDVRQIWRNCQLYNPKNSAIYASSQRLQEYFEILYSKFQARLDTQTH